VKSYRATTYPITSILAGKPFNARVKKPRPVEYGYENRKKFRNLEASAARTGVKC
jgi:hypothetical protein